MRNKFENEDKRTKEPFRKIRVIAAGLAFAIRNEWPVAYKVVLSIVFLGLGVFLHDWRDYLIVFLATALVLVAELFNTAIEGICDYLTSEQDERIKVIKDVSAAAVGVSLAAWIAVLILWANLVIVPMLFPG
jgi:diacylglycerol kinase (ATP)